MFLDSVIQNQNTKPWKMNRRFWTFETLLGAFLDLFIAYFLLYTSTIILFTVKFLSFFGFSLPPPFYNDNDYTRLLVDYPTDKVSAVKFLITNNFPFDSVFFRVNDRSGCDDNGVNAVNGEGDESCSDNSDSGVGFDVRGKGSLRYGLRGGLWRRRKARFDSGEEGSVSSDWVTCVDQQSCNNEEQVGSSVLSDANNYEAKTPMVVRSISRYHEEIVPGDPNDAHKKISVNEVDKDNMIVFLRQELEESHAARATLFVELEEERNAAASAADEAMSMVLRLQEEKASTKMELRQYQRMIEEKSAFDAEEMNILKEIVLRREREKHFLEKQVEAYRQMIRVENDQEITSRLYEDFELLKQEEPEKTIAVVGEVNYAYDVHVLDNENKRQTDDIQCGSETSIGMQPVSSKSSSRRNSTSALDNEQIRLDTEVEWLRERLRIVQEGRGKLIFSVENQEKESLQLELLEDIARQLREIRLVTEPQTACQASLPHASSKVGSTKKRRCRSVSSGLAGLAESS